MTARDDLRRMYLQCREQGIPVDGHVAYVAIQAVGDYASIRADYLEWMGNNIEATLLGDTTVSSGRRIAQRLIATHLVDAFETGWIETGGDPYQPDEADSNWLAARMNQELAYAEELFSSIQAMLKDTEEPITTSEAREYATARAEGYTRTLDGVYGQGKMRGKKTVLLTFDGQDGSPDNICQKNHGTCVKLKGQRHRARWWINRDLIPMPGNKNYNCGCYQCQHYLRDDKGIRWAGFLQ